MCTQTYENINNGVYRSGFATTQAAYDDAQTGLYKALGEVELRLSQSRFLLGDRCTVRLPPAKGGPNVGTCSMWLHIGFAVHVGHKE